MIGYRQAIKAVTPPILLEAARRIVRPLLQYPQTPATPPSPMQNNFPLTKAEIKNLTARMDLGDFDFDTTTVAKMQAAWEMDNASVPYPTALLHAYASGDAHQMNTSEVMDISYRLPYSIAYEHSQQKKYQDFIALAAKFGLDFNGAIVADVGAGFGSLLEIVGQTYPDTRLLAVEFAPSALTYVAKHSPRLEGKQADLNSTPEIFAKAVGEPVDIVLCTEVLEHLAHPHLALRNMLALKPRRGIALTVPNGRADTAGQHIHFWSPESWKLFIEEHSADWRTTTSRCPSVGTPGGFDNMVCLFPPDENQSPRGT